MKTSEEIKQIASAMVEVQKELKGIAPNANNPFFHNNYITLDNILDVVKPILSKNNIWLIQDASGDAESINVITRLIHTSGEFIETDSLKMKPVPKIIKDKQGNAVDVKNESDPQQLGSCITYAKRYQLSSLLAISSEIDDDADIAVNGEPNIKKVTKSMAEELRQLCKEKKISEIYICKYKGVNKFEELNSGQYQQALQWLKRR